MVGREGRAVEGGEFRVTSGCGWVEIVEANEGKVKWEKERMRKRRKREEEWEREGEGKKGRRGNQGRKREFKGAL